MARADGLLQATEAERPAPERLAKPAVYRLGVLLGREPGAVASELEPARRIPPTPPVIPATLPSELLSRRPDLRRAERELAAATARVGVARADLFPRFSILGSFGRRSEDAGDLGSGGSQFWRFIPGVRWPILSGGRIRANVRVQSARQEQALRQYEKAVLTALEEVENAVSSHVRERRRQESLRAAVAANRRALDLATDRYTGGVESFLSVLDAQRSVYAAEDQLVQSERNVADDRVLAGASRLDGSHRCRRGASRLLRRRTLVERGSHGSGNGEGDDPRQRSRDVPGRRDPQRAAAGVDLARNLRCRPGSRGLPSRYRLQRRHVRRRAPGDGPRLTAGREFPRGLLSSAVRAALSGAPRYVVAGDELRLIGESGVVLVFAAEPPPRLEGVTWEVTAFNNNRRAVISPIAGSRITLERCPILA